MSAGPHAGVGAADFRGIGSRDWTLFDHDGNILLSESEEHSASTSDLDHAAALFLHGPLRPTAIVLLVDENPGGAHYVHLDFAPLPVIRVSEALAASAAVPLAWRKFQFLNVASGVLWLIEKDGSTLLSANRASISSLAGPLPQATANFAAFGFEHIAFTGAASIPTGGLSLSTADLLLGARRRLTETPSGQGVHRSWRKQPEQHAEVVTLVTGRDIAYDVVHTPKPVFQLDEPSLADAAAGRPVLLVVDRSVDELYGDALSTYANARLEFAGKIALDASEMRKNLVAASRIAKYAASLGFPRNGIFVAIGGGVLLDIAGLAASLYRRGIGYLRVPTTLVGLIDAGLGIKQGVNFAGKKNILGSFYPPTAVVNDFTFLRTLPLRDISNGMAEIVKIALVKDARLFESLEEHAAQLCHSRFQALPRINRQVLLRSVVLMLEELQGNLFESNLRRLADFGHTFSPVIETRSRYAIAHGEAVAIDMLLSTAIARQLDLCPPGLLERLAKLLRSAGLPTAPPPCSLQDLVSALLAARQHRGGDLNLVVPAAPGHGVFVQDVPRSVLEAAVESIDALQENACRLSSSI